MRALHAWRIRPWFRELWFWREEQNSEFPKTFFGGYLFAFVEYLCNRCPKIKTKSTKNYSSILAIVNHRNWLDDSPPLSFIFFEISRIEVFLFL